ncbi:hypothetical protein SETIT_2G246000v2 [Setaria italica]|uniref:25S rRNA (uridine-N(3))-methyltransferase BMT5-like domain-containing protein n=1 Tax=Setaria italica TaxID=4555 RepID=A0A368Q2A5_SETIT|nr:hypothetical protein SETIT_2G246000v2 [Setaria italica]
MKFHTDLKNRRFDRIVFNFPHAGFNGHETELLHKKLVSGFFRNACHLLRRHGEIHISHKTGHPYDRWDLERLASKSSLVLIEKVGFHKEDYPGYNQKRGGEQDSQGRRNVRGGEGGGGREEVGKE